MADQDRLLRISSLEQLYAGDRLMADLVQQLGRTTNVNKLFARAAAGGLGMQLTPGAILMLMIPLIEAAQIQSEFTDLYRMSPPPSLSVNRDMAEASISSLLRYIESSPAAADLSLQPFRESEGRPQLTSLSAIKAFWRGFCNIPPFCGEPRG
jgi:hypothetical protein